MKTTHLDNEINRLKWLKQKDDLSPIGENALIEYEAIKQALTIPDVVNQREVLKAFAELMLKKIHSDDEMGVDDWIKDFLNLL